MRKLNWIIMPIFEQLALTRDAVKSCLEQDIGNVRVLCVLDKATDGVGQYLRSLHPQVQVVAMPGCGVSKGWNAALSHVIDFREADAALVVNSDVRLRPDAYRRLLSDGGLFVTCVGTSSGAKFPGEEPSGRKRPHPDFSCFLIRKECWQEIGQFDEAMRIYTSDLDYHIRMQQAGIDAMCLDLPFFHYSSGTLKTVDEADRDRILKQAQIDREAFEKKWRVVPGSSEYYKLFQSQKEKDELTNAQETSDDVAALDAVDSERLPT